MSRLAFASAFVFAALALTPPTQAETVNCTAIAALLANITVQGIRCITGALTTAMTSGAAITINTNNGVLDLNGFKLGGLLAGLGTKPYGIRANNGQNATIKNGTVRGFKRGIFVEDSGASQGHVVEDIRADQNTVAGINVQGSGTIIRNNQVVATGGATCCGANASASGIVVSGNGPRVLNNDVINAVKQGTALARGIEIGTIGGLAVNNRITGADIAIDFASGTGKYCDNLTFAVPTPRASTAAQMPATTTKDASA